MTRVFLLQVGQEQQAVEALSDLLEQEANAMSQGDFSALPALTERKLPLIDRIAQLDRERELEQVRLGYSSDRSGANALAAAGGEILQAAWLNLSEKAMKAHALNHRNGIMVHAHLDFVRQSINFLKASSQQLYGPDGAHYSGESQGNRLAAG